jgi:4'-phosphopantetheinyl transferase
MSKEELAVMDKAKDKRSMFYKIWTLKEAYVKYCGRGLGDALSKLTIYPDKEKIKASVSGCQFALIDSLPGYQAAVCASDCNNSSVEWVRFEQLAVI